MYLLQQLVGECADAFDVFIVDLHVGIQVVQLAQQSAAVFVVAAELVRLHLQLT